MADQFDHEEAEIERQYEEGEISEQEYAEALMELRRDYRAAAREAAQEAYDRELERW